MEPTETKPSSRPTMKRRLSTEEPHSEVKKPVTGIPSLPPTASSTLVVSEKEVVGPVQADSLDPRSAKATIETTKPQPSSQNSRKRKFSQTDHPDNLCRWLLIEDHLRDLVLSRGRA